MIRDHFNCGGWGSAGESQTVLALEFEEIIKMFLDEWESPPAPTPSNRTGANRLRNFRREFTRESKFVRQPIIASFFSICPGRAIA